MSKTTNDPLECWRCGGEGEGFDPPSHPDGGGTICHTCWERMFGTATNDRLETERRQYKATADALERQAQECLASGNREGWEHFAHEADMAWRMNGWCVGEIDRLTEGRP